MENSCEIRDDDIKAPLGNVSNIVDEKWIFNQVSYKMLIKIHNQIKWKYYMGAIVYCKSLKRKTYNFN